MRALVIVLRLLLAGVFLFAAYTKLRQPWLLFAMSIDSYAILPEWAVLATARILPWAELLLGVVLLTGLWLRYAAIAATVILSIFLAAVLRSYIKGMAIDCGCFGVGEALSAKTLIRDGALIASAVALTILAMRGSNSRRQSLLH
jgi:uncharacterized membrane protein YphA (DoxX/SURF4 family)